MSILTHTWLIFCLLQVGWSSSPLMAATQQQTAVTYPSKEDIVDARRKAIEDEQAVIARSEKELADRRADVERRGKELTSTTVTENQLEEARLAVEQARLNLEAIGLEKQATERRQKELGGQISVLEKRLADAQSAAKKTDEQKAQITVSQGELGNNQSLLELEVHHYKNLETRTKLAQERLSLAESWRLVLEENYQAQRREAVEGLEQRLTKERDTLRTRAQQLREQSNKIVDDSEDAIAARRLLDVRIKGAEESAYLLEVKLKQAQWKSILDEAGRAVLRDQPEAEFLHEVLARVRAVSSELESTQALTTRKLTVLNQQIEVINKRQNETAKPDARINKERKIVKGLNKQFQRAEDELQQQSQAFRQQTETLERLYQDSVRRGLLARHRFPVEPEPWADIFKELVNMPVMIFTLPRDAWQAAQTNLAQTNKTNPPLALLIVFLELIWIVAWWWAARSIKHHHQPVSTMSDAATADTEESFWHKMQGVLLSAVRHNRILIGLGGALLIAQWGGAIIAKAYIAFVSLVLIVLAARMLAGIGDGLIKTTQVHIQHPLSNLSYWYRWTLYIVAIWAVMLSIAGLDFVSAEFNDFLQRLFLAFMLIPTYVAWRIRSLLLELLHATIKNSPNWIRLVRIVSFMVPFTVLCSAILGLLGYVNMAWSVAAHLGIFLMVLCVWLILRGLLQDAAYNAKNYVSVQHPEQSLVLAQGVIDPLHSLLKVVLLLLSGWVLSVMYGMGGDSTAFVAIEKILKYPLFTIGETGVDLKHTLTALIWLVVVFFLARWVRETTYRWFYASIGDIGIRNSLSVFTQYLFILIGVLIALNALGVNLTSIAIFTGALGVGIGFGLQNIANNFISGIILLGERPIRSGDWVTIGDYEGEVSRIGIRSVTVTTWDNQDVIIPNADLINNSFINWTRTNSVVRTVIMLGVSYHDDPHKAQKVILEAVKSHPLILQEPAPKVWLREFGNSSVDFRLHYFADIRAQSRLAVKSEVMFIIWDALKRENIQIPFPQQDVYIKELPTAEA